MQEDQRRTAAGHQRPRADAAGIDVRNPRIDAQERLLGLLPGLFVSALPLGTRAVIEVLATGVVQIFTSPFILILLTLVYYDIRIRREAFDIEMLAQSI